MTGPLGRTATAAQLAVLLFSAVLLPDCWIPLPEETAIVVEVFDARGAPVDGVRFILDSEQTIVTGSQVDIGQVFVSLNTEGDHTIQLETDSLIDPQGGIRWVPLASAISGADPVSYDNKPFAGGSDVLIVPVNKGEITVATVFLDEALKSPMDNQWLTDGSNPSPYRPDDNVDEFQNNPEPVFWWRPDPSVVGTVTYTFQLWEDDDGDTRYPLGIAADPDNPLVGPALYRNAMNPSHSDYIQPDWEVPLAGVQRAEEAGVNQMVLWSSQASDNNSSVKYDLYYSPTALWDSSKLESNQVLRDVAHAGAFDGRAVKFSFGNGTSNHGLILKNGTQYTVALRARDLESNLDSATLPRSTRLVTPRSSATLGSASISSAFADSTVGGSIDLTIVCQNGDSLRIYAAPESDFIDWPFDTRFIRDDTYLCGTSPNPYRLDRLINGEGYAVGVEVFDASGNAGPASSMLLATPSSDSAIDTTAPTGAGITVTEDGGGQVTLNIAAVSDEASSVFRRVYWSSSAFTSNEEAMLFTDLAVASSGSAVTLTVGNIPNGVPYQFRVRAIDYFGNSSSASAPLTLSSVADTTGPTWATDVPALSTTSGSFFTSVAYVDTNTPARADTWDLGFKWSYASTAGGFALGQDPDQGKGEYVWRVVKKGRAVCPWPPSSAPSTPTPGIITLLQKAEAWPCLPLRARPTMTVYCALSKEVSSQRMSWTHPSPARPVVTGRGQRRPS